jgi:ribosome-associated protein
VAEKVKAAGGSVYGIEGEETGEWILVDLGDVLVHVMQSGTRAHYNLEELWAEAKKIKRATASAPGGTSPVSALGERSEAPAQAGAKPKMSKTSESQLDPDGED